MKKIIITLFLLPVFTVVIFISCKKEKSCEGCKENNKSPIANTGKDTIIFLPANSVWLDISASADPDGTITSFKWTKISGPSSFNLANSNSVKTGVTNLVMGMYLFELKIADSRGLISKDTLKVTVYSITGELSHWTRLDNLPENEFFIGNYTTGFFSGSNILMGIGDKVFAVSFHGDLWPWLRGNSWFKTGPFPEFMKSKPTVFAINDKGYFLGNGRCWQYDPLTDQWTRKNDVPNYISNDAVPLVINNKICLVSSADNQVMAYDPASDTYTQKNNFPGAGAATGFVVNGEGYFLDEALKCWKYQSSTDNWQQKASLQVSSISSMTGFSLNNSGYIIGDLNGNAHNHNDPMKVWSYDPSLNQWKQFDEDYPGGGCFEISAVSVNGIVYVGLGSTNADFNAIDFWRFK